MPRKPSNDAGLDKRSLRQLDPAPPRGAVGHEAARTDRRASADSSPDLAGAAA